MKPFNLKAFVIQILRRGSYRFQNRNEALKLAKIERNQYRCAACAGIFERKEVQIDHINPVVPIEGWDSWDGYIARMFCEIDQWQILCLSCHKSKTFLENELRKQYRTEE